jgi:hypothetical protein
VSVVDFVLKEKRGIENAIQAFPCIPGTKTATCNNGGKGPRITKGKRTMICACVCPYGFRAPRCEKEWWNA